MSSNRTYDDRMFIETFEHEYTWLNGFLRNVRRYGNKPALIDPSTDTTWTYKELDAECNQFAHALKDDKELYEKAEKLTIINTSASKTFNLAGLQVANTIIKDKTLKDKVEVEIGKTGYHRISQAAQVALISAYTNEGFEWACELKKYIYDNILYVKSFIEKNIPKIKVIETEGTYLMWFDFREYGLNDTELQKKLTYEAKVHLDNGLKFGTLGNGFMRMNVATSRKNIENALHNIKEQL